MFSFNARKIGLLFFLYILLSCLTSSPNVLCQDSGASKENNQGDAVARYRILAEMLVVQTRLALQLAQMEKNVAESKQNS